MNIHKKRASKRGIIAELSERMGIVRRNKFEKQMNNAIAFQRVATDQADSAYWRGYIRGMRRAYLGDKYGTADKNEIPLLAVNNPDGIRRRGDQGYNDGLKAFKSMA